MLLRDYQSWVQLRGPQNDDQLHQYLKDEFDLDVPRVAVCPGHIAPFTFLADLYFERVLSAIAMANRGGSKTFLAALWLFLTAKFRAGSEGASVASEQQTQRAYEHLKSIIKLDFGGTNEEDHPDIDSSVMRKTTWTNGSLYEIIIATMSGTSGPHPQKVHTDEVEWMDPAVFQNSRQMSQTKKGIKAQDVITSTRYRAIGLMQQIWDECDAAERSGFEPPYKRYQWCCFETAQRVPNCQVADPGLPEGERCNCEKIAKGYWESGDNRTFRDICQGRLARSDGWVPLHDLHKSFRASTRPVWEAQQECSRPEQGGMCLPEWDENRHGLKTWMPDPKNGPIYGCVDFGGTNPHAVMFGQLVMREEGVAAQTIQGMDIMVKKGALVMFDEIYKAKIPPTKLAELTWRTIDYWTERLPEFRIAYFFYDVQGASQKMEWAVYERPIILTNLAKKDVDVHITYWRDRFEEDKFYAVTGRTPFLKQEIESWHRPEAKPGMVDEELKPIKDFDHTVDATRYMIANLRILERGGGLDQGSGGSSGGHQTAEHTASGPDKYLPRDQTGRESYPFPRSGGGFGSGGNSTSPFDPEQF